MHRRVVLNLTLALGILIGAGGCADGSPVASAPEASSFQLLTRASEGARFDRSGSGDADHVEATIDATGGELATAGGYRIVFPAGAFSEPTRVSLREVPGFVGVELEPSGLRFPTNASPVLTIPLSGARTGGFRTLVVASVEHGRIDEVLTTSVSSTTMTATVSRMGGYLGAGD